MQEIYEELGKVSVTVEGRHDIDKPYEKISIVTDEKNNSYISKKDVPVGISLNDEEYWMLLANSAGNIENFDASVTHVNTVDSFSLAEARARVNKTVLEFEFSIPKGEKGKDGTNGIDGISTRSAFIFKTSKDKPETPSGGYWDLASNIITPPSGWQNDTTDLESPIWMSSCNFGPDGTPASEWSIPVRISGQDGENGTDGTNIQFIYKLTEDEHNIPERPLAPPRDDYAAPTGWNNHPKGVSKTNKAEWACMSTKSIDNKWSKWSEPFLWSNYGVSGLDGDGIKYAYKKTDSKEGPERPEGDGSNVEAPIGWTDDPEGVDKINRWEWVTISRYDGKTKKWSNWSIPSLWATFGEKGDNGISGRTIFVFKPSIEIPVTPTGGSWDIETNVVTPPEGWFINTSEMPNPDQNPIWMSTGVFNEKGLLIGEWNIPIRVTGNDGENGTDGGNTQFIYKISKNEHDIPEKPTTKPNDDFTAPVDWTDHPVGINEHNKSEWVCIATKQSAETGWTDWQGPTLWSNYGTNGMDGDGIKYAYKKTNTAENPGKPSGTGESVEFPIGWTDDPMGVDEEYQWEWVTVSKYNGGTKTWSEWSVPSLWSKFGKNGINGLSVEIRYTKTTGSSDIPEVNKSSRYPGVIWGVIIPNRDNTSEAIWGTQAYITNNNELAKDWTNPYLITGVDGVSPVKPNYTIYVYKESINRPNKPIGDNINPGDNWVDFPTTQGQWWQCVGTVNGQTNTVTNWGEVVQLNGKDGTAKDGKFTEFRFAKSIGNDAPSLDKGSRKPAGWTIEYPSINLDNNESLWMTKANIDSDDSLISSWDNPVRISGEKGSEGKPGPAGKPGGPGPSGVSGIPGKYIEVRYCIGTENSYVGTSVPGSTRYPSNWQLTVPSTTTSNKYIWFIQAAIAFNDNDDSIGHVESAWSKPTLLSGINGLPGRDGDAGPRGWPGQDGAPGAKGQITYPAGIYDLDTAYTTDSKKAPYVLDPNDGNYYVLNSQMTWIGSRQGNRYPYNDNTNSWLLFNKFDAIFAKIGIIAHGLIGSAVFYNQYMFSQQGVGNYKDFNGNINGPFKPNFCINFLTGKVYNNQLYKKWVYYTTDTLSQIDLSNGFNYVLTAIGSASFPVIKLPTDISEDGVELNILYIPDSSVLPITFQCSNEIYAPVGNSAPKHGVTLNGGNNMDLYKFVSFKNTNGKLSWACIRGHITVL